MSQKAAKDFMDKVEGDEGLAKQFDEALDMDDADAGMNAIGALAKEQRLEFTPAELNTELVGDDAELSPEELGQVSGGAVPGDARKKYGKYGNKWLKKLGKKGPNPLAKGPGVGPRAAPFAFGDPGAGGVTKQRSKKLPWRASW